MPEGAFTADITAIRERARISQLGGDILADEEEHADVLVDLLGV